MNSLVRGCRASALFAALGLTLFFAAGCGYQFTGAVAPGRERIESVHIPLIKSPSTLLGFEGDFTRILRGEFISHGIAPRESMEGAGAVLIGEVHEVRTDPLSYTFLRTPVQGETASYGVTNNRRLTIRFGARLIDRQTGRVLWEDPFMEEKSSFSIGTDPLVNRYNERRALAEIAERFARRVYLKTIERF